MKRQIFMMLLASTLIDAVAFEDQEIKGSAISIGINITPNVTPKAFVTMQEKLSSDLNLTRAEIALDPAFDNDGYRKLFAGLKSGSMPLPFYLRKGSTMYKFLYDAWESGESIEIKRDDPVKTLTGFFRVMEFSEADTGNEAVIRVNTTLQLTGPLAKVYKPAA